MEIDVNCPKEIDDGLTIAIEFLGPVGEGENCGTDRFVPSNTPVTSSLDD
jgi:hypothetical protein